jgi:hypothetical protein
MRISDWGFRIENNKISIKTESEFRNPCPPSLSPLRHRLRLKAIAGRAQARRAGAFLYPVESRLWRVRRAELHRAGPQSSWFITHSG